MNLIALTIFFQVCFPFFFASREKPTAQFQVQGHTHVEHCKELVTQQEPSDFFVQTQIRYVFG